MCHLCTPITSLGRQSLDQIGVANAVRDKWGRLFYASPETANLKTVLLYLNLISIVSQHAERALVSDDYRGFDCRCGLEWMSEGVIVFAQV